MAYSQEEIDAFSLKGVRRPGSLVDKRKGGVIDLSDFSSRMATGRKPATKPPTEVEMEYFRIVSESMEQGKPVPTLQYNGQLWYYNRGGKKGADGVKDLSLRNYGKKLGLEKKYAETRDVQTPKLEDYEEAFPGRGKEMYDAEQAKRKLQIKAQKDAIARTGKDFDLDHMRPNMNQGRTHSRNFRLMDAGRNRLEQNRRPLTDTQLTALKQDATNNVDYLRTQGPEMTPRQRQNVIEGVTKLPEAPAIKMFREGAQAQRLSGLRKKAALAAGAGLAGVSILGTGASAAETETRRQIASQTGDIADKIQAGISGVSLAADLASYTPIGAIPGTIISTGADALNIVVDMFRQGATHQHIRGRIGAQKALQQR